MNMFLMIGGFALAAMELSAQSVPSITRTKANATRAVAATNAHTQTMTRPVEDTAAADTGRRVSTDSAGGTAAVSVPAAPRAGEFSRETFAYERGGRRDPFVSLMSTSDLRPLISDLRIVGILNDAGGRSSVAILRDLNTKEQYRIRTGQSLGRMRVAHIAQKSVTFTIEEFGYSRQEVLSLTESNTEKKQ